MVINFEHTAYKWVKHMHKNQTKQTNLHTWRPANLKMAAWTIEWND